MNTADSQHAQQPVLNFGSSGHRISFQNVVYDGYFSTYENVLQTGSISESILGGIDSISCIHSNVN